MRYSCLWVSLVCALATSSALATENKTAEETSRFETLQQLKKLRAEQFKVDANAAQSEEIRQNALKNVKLSNDDLKDD